MEKNTSILLGDYFEEYIQTLIESGKFTSASEVIRPALRLFEYEDKKRTELIKELEKGERSGFVADFNREKFLNGIHEKYVQE